MPEIHSRDDQANNPGTVGPARDSANNEHESNCEYSAVNVLPRPRVHRMPPSSREASANPF